VQKQYEAQQTASERLWQMFSHFQASLDEDGSGRGGAGGAGREAGGAGRDGGGGGTGDIGDAAVLADYATRLASTKSLDHRVNSKCACGLLLRARLIRSRRRRRAGGGECRSQAEAAKTTRTRIATGECRVHLT
jgi:hypothetical protein